MTESMTLNEYQNEARRTAPRSLEAYPSALRELSSQAVGFIEQARVDELTRIFDILIWGQGLAGEAGEVCDLLKKVHGHGKPRNDDQMRKELGDVIWYVANLADAHGFTLAEVAQANVDKLKARYPQGFTVAAAAAKADETPRAACPNCGRQGHAACLHVSLSGIPTERP